MATKERYGVRADTIPRLTKAGEVAMAATFAVVFGTGVALLAGVVYFSPTYSNKLLMLGLPWGITAPVFMLLTALALRTHDVAGGSAAGPASERPILGGEHGT